MMLKYTIVDNQPYGRLIEYFKNLWLYTNHFDVNNLIENGFALKAPDNMYQ